MLNGGGNEDDKKINKYNQEKSTCGTFLWGYFARPYNALQSLFMTTKFPSLSATLRARELRYN